MNDECTCPRLDWVNAPGTEHRYLAVVGGEVGRPCPIHNLTAPADCIPEDAASDAGPPQFTPRPRGYAPHASDTVPRCNHVGCTKPATEHDASGPYACAEHMAELRECMRVLCEVMDAPRAEEQGEGVNWKAQFDSANHYANLWFQGTVAANARADRAEAALRGARQDLVRFNDGTPEGTLTELLNRIVCRIDAALSTAAPAPAVSDSPANSAANSPAAPDLRGLLREAVDWLDDVHEGTCPQHWANVHVAQVHKQVQPADCACGVEAWRTRARVALDAGEVGL